MIEYTESVNYNSLMRLFNQEVLVLCVKDFIHYPKMDVILQQAYSSIAGSYFYEHNKVSHIGNSSYDIDNYPDKFGQYYAAVEKNFLLMQSLFSPSPTPLDYFKKATNQAWSHGVEVASIHQKKMFAGIIRIIHQGSAIHAHQDRLKTSNPNAQGLDIIQGQFGMNYYMRVPKQGGALYLWDKILSEEEFNKQSEGDFCIPIHKLPPADVVLQPEEGMLSLINANRLHAISTSVTSDRVGLSCFLAYRGQDKPLSIWS